MEKVNLMQSLHVPVLGYVGWPCRLLCLLLGKAPLPSKYMAEFARSYFSIHMREWKDLSAEENFFSQNTDMTLMSDTNIRRKDKKFRNPEKLSQTGQRKLQW